MRWGQQIAQARRIAAQTVGLTDLQDRWSGLSVEAAWRALQLAREELLFVLPDEELRGDLPYWIKLAEAHGDRELVTTLRSWHAQQGHIDPHLIRPLLASTHVANNEAHTALRRLRNRVLVWALLLGVIVVGVWSVGEVTSGDIVGIGALGGLLSVVFTVKNDDLGASYNVQFAQGLLKVASGAATAVLAVLILKGSGASSDTEHVYAYAAIFGFSQQAFTRLVDEKAQSLTAKAPARANATRHPPPAGK